MARWILPSRRSVQSGKRRPAARSWPFSRAPLLGCATRRGRRRSAPPVCYRDGQHGARHFAVGSMVQPSVVRVLIRKTANVPCLGDELMIEHVIYMDTHGDQAYVFRWARGIEGPWLWMVAALGPVRDRRQLGLEPRPRAAVAWPIIWSACTGRQMWMRRGVYSRLLRRPQPVTCASDNVQEDLMGRCMRLRTAVRVF